MNNTPSTTPSQSTSPKAAEANSLGNNYAYSRHVLHVLKSEYAGLWLRTMAYLIDFFIMAILYYLCMKIIVVANIQNKMLDFRLISEFVHAFFLLLIAPFYLACCESSKYGGSLGKIILRILVIGKRGEKNSFGTSLGRAYFKLISVGIIPLCHIIVAFTKKKQGLHDMGLSTYVIKRSALTNIYKRNIQLIQESKMKPNHSFLTSEQLQAIIKETDALCLESDHANISDTTISR